MTRSLHRPYPRAVTESDSRALGERNFSRRPEDIEGERNTDPCAAQNQRFFKRYRVSLAVKYPKIEGK